MVPCIGLASGIGAGNPGCANGPLELRKRLNLDWRGLILPKGEKMGDMNEIARLNRSLANLSFSLTKEEPFFLSLGGDHSCGVGTWSGTAAALRSEGELGLIWIDAHMDAHTCETSESGNIHGMPLAALLGLGDKRLTSIGGPFPKIRPENLVLIGTRSFEPAELKLLTRLNVRIFMMDEVRQRGVGPIFQEAIEIATENTAGYGVSFDLDSIDPLFAPAVGTPVEGGLDPDEFLKTLHYLEAIPPLAFELAEYNPLLDVENKSFNLIQQLLERVTASVQTSI